MQNSNIFTTLPIYQPFHSLNSTWYPISTQLPANVRSNNLSQTPYKPIKETTNLPEWVTIAPAFKRKRYILKSTSTNFCDLTRNNLTKPPDIFYYDAKAKILAAIGPRKSYSKEISYVYAIGNSNNNSKTIITISDSLALCEENTNWLSQKSNIRTEEIESMTLENMICYIDAPNVFIEFDLYDLNCFLKSVFCHWDIVYDPEISSIIIMRRIKINNGIKPNEFDNCMYNKNQLKDTKDTNVGISIETNNDLPKNSPIEIIVNWMLNQELKAFSDAQNNLNLNEARTKIPSYVSEDSDIYTNLPGWMKCIFIISPKDIIIHKAKNDTDLDTAWQYLFPLIRRFLSYIPEIPEPPSNMIYAKQDSCNARSDATFLHSIPSGIDINYQKVLN